METQYAASEPKRADVDASTGPLVLEFCNPWCGYCRRAQPFIAQAFVEHPGVRHLKIADANQEHGILSHRSGDASRMPALPVGALVRILPNHACATAAQHERYNVVRGSRRIEAAWERIRGW